MIVNRLAKVGFILVVSLVALPSIVNTQRIQVMFDVFNVLNENSITESDRFYGPNYQRPQAIMPGRLAKFAVQYNF